MSYRTHQQSHGSIYGGSYATDASHYLSCQELNHFGVSVAQGNHPSNYRNCNEFTNRSYHKQIDNALMDAHSSRASSLGGFHYAPTSGRNSGCDFYVSPQAMVDRLTHKVAKESGAINNPRLQNYMMKSADRLNMDMRIFNGVGRRQIVCIVVVFCSLDNVCSLYRNVNNKNLYQQSSYTII